ncbi:hypothetical protein Acsp05_41190 [Actinokineospora sp. NBRC 105648]|nr:hypothetical protein Acsp05_41190 [Actinokineospora sp. NBRC 105648]
MIGTYPTNGLSLGEWRCTSEATPGESRRTNKAPLSEWHRINESPLSESHRIYESPLVETPRFGKPTRSHSRPDNATARLGGAPLCGGRGDRKLAVVVGCPSPSAFPTTIAPRGPAQRRSTQSSTQLSPTSGNPAQTNPPQPMPHNAGGEQ